MAGRKINHLLRLLPLLVYHAGALPDTEELPFRKSILLKYKHAYFVVHFNIPFLYLPVQCSVADRDPNPDPYVFGPPGY